MQQQKKEEAAAKKKKKAANDIEDATKRKELLGGFEAELQHKNMAGILGLPDSCMRQYIHYYFEKKVVNLQKQRRMNCKQS